jgi:hypothetical protein
MNFNLEDGGSTASETLVLSDLFRLQEAFSSSPNGYVYT